MKTLLLLTAALVMSAACGYAATDNVGAVELNLVKNIFTGNFGMILGLIVAIMGIVEVIRGDTGGGILLVALGALITLLPMFYTGITVIICPVAEALGAHCGSS